MGKGELWDDSALVKAFDRAISTYKRHGVAEEENAAGDVIQAKEDLDCGSTELQLETEPDTSSKLEETASNPQVMESSPLGLSSDEKQVVPLDSQIGSVPSTSNPYANSNSHENEHMIGGSEAKGPEDYSSLLNKYYELEDQRQKVLQQLYQYGNGNDYHESEYQASVPQAYDTVACYCPYGCQNWVVPCNSSQVPCPECACSGKGKELTNETHHSIESADASTDLSVVLNAWYSAGFYTAKYLSEQSAANKK